MSLHALDDSDEPRFRDGEEEIETLDCRCGAPAAHFLPEAGALACKACAEDFYEENYGSRPSALRSNCREEP